MIELLHEEPRLSRFIGDIYVRNSLYGFTLPKGVNIQDVSPATQPHGDNRLSRSLRTDLAMWPVAGYGTVVLVYDGKVSDPVIRRD